MRLWELEGYERRDIMWGLNEQVVFEKDAFNAKGKTIKNVIAYDALGYDRGFELVFTDGSKLEITPRDMPAGLDGRIKIKFKMKGK